MPHRRSTFALSHFRTLALPSAARGRRNQQRAGKRCRERCDLHGDPLRLEAECILVPLTSAVGPKRRSDSFGTFGDLVRRHADSHVGLGIDVVPEVKRALVAGRADCGTFMEVK